MPTAPVLMESRRRHFIFFILGAVTVSFFTWNLASRDIHLSSTAEPRWEDPGPYHVAYPRDYKIIMDDTPTCKNMTPFLVLMVPVAPSDVAARDTIRKTWGKETQVLGQLVETLFILGLPGGADAEQQQEKLKQENLQHHDLIQSNFQDSYRNLTIKTMMMLEWLAQGFLCHKD